MDEKTQEELDAEQAERREANRKACEEALAAVQAEARKQYDALPGREPNGFTDPNVAGVRSNLANILNLCDHGLADLSLKNTL